MTLRFQIVCVAALLLGALLGGRSGHRKMSGPAAAPPSSRASSKGDAAHTSGTARRAAGSAATGSSSSERNHTSATPATTINDLRALLAQDLFRVSQEKWNAEMARVIVGLPDADLRAALDLCLADWKSRKRQLVLGAVVERLADRLKSSSAAVMLDWAVHADITPREKQFLAAFALITTDEHDDPLAVWKSLADAGLDVPGQWLNFGIFSDTLVEKIARQQPAEAGSLAAAQSDASVRMKSIPDVATVWAEKDADAALRWLNSLKPDTARDAAMIEVMGTIADRDAVRALRMLKDIADPTLAADARVAVFEHMSVEAASDMIERGEIRADMQREMTALARHNLMAGSFDVNQRTMQMLPSGPVRDAFALVLAETQTSAGTFDRSMGVITQMSPGPERWDAMRDLGSSRAHHSVADTTSWLATLPAGFGRDAAIEGFASHVAEKDPKLATEWSSSVGDPIFRQRTMQDAYKAWASRDPAASAAWLAATPNLSATEKAHLTEKTSKH